METQAKKNARVSVKVDAKKVSAVPLVYEAPPHPAKKDGAGGDGGDAAGAEEGDEAAKEAKLKAAAEEQESRASAAEERAAAAEAAKAEAQTAIAQAEGADAAILVDLHTLCRLHLSILLWPRRAAKDGRARSRQPLEPHRDQ